MANLDKVKSKEVKITLNDGVERKIKFTLNALAELEDIFGSVEAAFSKLEQNSMKAVRAILWAGLLYHSPELTEQQVGNLIDIEYLQELTQTIDSAFDQDMPTPDESTPGVVASPNQ